MRAYKLGRFESEAAFRDHLCGLLRFQGIRAKKEVGAFRRWDNHPYLLRCDIALPEPGGLGCTAVIECKLSAKPQALGLALGQAILYKRAFLASHTILCFPASVVLPGLFAEVCTASRVHLATERDLLATLASLGTDADPRPTPPR